MYVKDIMHTAVATVTPETRVSTAYQRMTTREARIRHLPVVTDERTLVGILTDRDVRRAAASDARPWPSTNCSTCWTSCASGTS